MAVLMVVGRPLRVLVVDADRRPVIGKFLDNPAVFGASGLDLKEAIRLAGNPFRYVRYAIETPFREAGKRRPFL